MYARRMNLYSIAVEMYIFEEKQDEFLIIGRGQYPNGVGKNNIFMTRYNEQFNYIVFSKAVGVSIYPVGATYAPNTYPNRFILHPSEDYVYIVGYSDGWTSAVSAEETGYLAKIYVNDPIVTHEVSLDALKGDFYTRYYDIEMTR